MVAMSNSSCVGWLTDVITRTLADLPSASIVWWLLVGGEGSRSKGKGKDAIAGGALWMAAPTARGDEAEALLARGDEEAPLKVGERESGNTVLTNVIFYARIVDQRCPLARIENTRITVISQK